MRAWPALLLLPLLATAQEDLRLDFKGVPLDAPLAEVQKAFKLRCGPDPLKRADTVCEYVNGRDATMAGIPAGMLRLEFMEGRFDGVTAILPPSSYEVLRGSLGSKLHPCDEPDPTTFLCTFMRNGDRAYLLRMKGAVALTYESRTGAEARSARRAAAVRKKAGDL